MEQRSTRPSLHDVLSTQISWVIIMCVNDWLWVKLRFLRSAPRHSSVSEAACVCLRVPVRGCAHVAMLQQPSASSSIYSWMAQETPSATHTDRWSDWQVFSCCLCVVRCGVVCRASLRLAVISQRKNGESHTDRTDSLILTKPHAQHRYKTHTHTTRKHKRTCTHNLTVMLVWAIHLPDNQEHVYSAHNFSTTPGVAKGKRWKDSVRETGYEWEKVKVGLCSMMIYV